MSIGRTRRSSQNGAEVSMVPRSLRRRTAVIFMAGGSLLDLVGCEPNACAGRFQFSAGAIQWRSGAGQGFDMAAVAIYGIKACDTMRKARNWLDEHGVVYEFHDYKTQGIDRRVLEG